MLRYLSLDINYLFLGNHSFWEQIIFEGTYSSIYSCLFLFIYFCFEAREERRAIDLRDLEERQKEETAYIKVTETFSLYFITH